MVERHCIFLVAACMFKHHILPSDAEYNNDTERGHTVIYLFCILSQMSWQYALTDIILIFKIVKVTPYDKCLFLPVVFKRFQQNISAPVKKKLEFKKSLCYNFNIKNVQRFFT